MKPRDLHGRVFGNWTVIARAGSDSGRNALWVCRCVCGSIRNVVGYTLTSGTSSGCGCIKKALGHTSAGKTSAEYMAWRQMRRRCTNRNATGYKDYGGRGITVCKEWDTFEGFFSDMGPRPSLLHSIDRIDNNGPYTPMNCRWSTKKEQSNNTRSNHLVEYEGSIYTISNLARKMGATRSRINYWLRTGRLVTASLEGT
jgi:hypothetical protein